MANVTLNANYNKFVDWAKQFDANSSAIVGASNMLGEGLVVDTKLGDGSGFIAMIRRSGIQKDINNTTRALFFDAVKEMFGGESKIPENVRKAMKFDNFTNAQTGKPLTARRILFVKAAIEEFAAQPRNKLVDPSNKKPSINDYGRKSSPAEIGINIMATATRIKTSNAAELRPVKSLSMRQAREMIDKSASVLKLGSGAKLSEDQKELAANCLRDFGRKMPSKNLNVLSNYIVSRLAQGTLYEDDVALFAKDVGKWRDFSFGDPKMSQLGAKVAQRFNDTIQEYFGKTDWGLKKDKWCMTDNDKKPLQKNVAQQFWEDAESCNWNMDGTQIKSGMQGATLAESRKNVLEALLGAITNKVKGQGKQLLATHVLSTLLNQLVFADMATIQRRTEAVDGVDPNSQNTENLYEMNGGDMFVSRDTEGDVTKSIVVQYGKSMGLEISDDGKTATITTVHDDHITTTGGSGEEGRIGKVTTAQKITIDLTGQPLPTVTNVAFSQKFTPDEVFEKGNALNA